MILYILLLIFLLFISIICINTIRFKTEISKTEAKESNIAINLDRVSEKLTKAIQIPTISYIDNNKIDYSQFKSFINMLSVQFPKVHEKLTCKKINEYSLLYKWQGLDSELKPVLLLSHYDVVPVADGTLEDWNHPPFSGNRSNDFIWGRGCIDTKITLISALESAELLLEQNFTPQRDIYFAFGHDEEINGINGAKKVVQYLKEQNLDFEFVLDEGGIVSTDSVPGINKSVALVGISEKGNVDIEISVKGEGGHASMPPKSTALGKIGQVIVNIEKYQRPLRLTKPVELFLKSVGPLMGLTNRIILSNLWLFKPLFKTIFSRTNSGNALLRTTTAVTMSQASNAPNVLPQDAKTTVNFRIVPGDSIDNIIKHIKKVNKGIKLDTKVLKGANPSNVSDINTFGYNKIKTIINSVFPNVLVAPYLVMAATDSRHYEEVSTSVYRFAPLLLDKKQVSSIHNTNEKISLGNIENAVSFYLKLIHEL